MLAEYVVGGLVVSAMFGLFALYAWACDHL